MLGGEARVHKSDSLAGCHHLRASSNSFAVAGEAVRTDPGEWVGTVLGTSPGSPGLS